MHHAHLKHELLMFDDTIVIWADVTAPFHGVLKVRDTSSQILE